MSLTRDFGDEVVQVDFTAREYVRISHVQLIIHQIVAGMPMHLCCDGQDHTRQNRLGAE